MGVWIVFALLTAFAVFSVLWPLSRSAPTGDRAELDVAFYKAQAAEIDRDAARGVIGAEEAATARTEAARRLMAAARRDGPVREGGSLAAVRLASLGALLFVPIAALALYAKIGKPELPDLPLEARLTSPPAAMELSTAIAKIERHLVDHPDDGRGYEVLAPTYLRIGRPEDSGTAYAKAIALLGPTAERYAGLGEAQVAIGNGVVTAEAKASFDKAFALDPRLPQAAYYLGVAAQQDGDKPRALDLWRKLIAASPPEAPWLDTVKARIAALSGEALPEGGSSRPGGSDRAQMAAAIQAMPDTQRQDAIHGMVDRLAERLKGNGSDLEGWLRLVRAYRVMNEQDKAKGALADARRTFATNAEAAQRLDALARELGLEG